MAEIVIMTGVIVGAAAFSYYNWDPSQSQRTNQRVTNADGSITYRGGGDKVRGMAWSNAETVQLMNLVNPDVSPTGEKFSQEQRAIVYELLNVSGNDDRSQQEWDILQALLKNNIDEGLTLINTRLEARNSTNT